MRVRAIVAAAAVGLFGVLAVAGPASASPAPGDEPAAVTEGHEGADVSHAAEECIELLEAGGEPDDCNEAPSPILPAKDELIWGVLSFVVLFVLMAKFALPGIQKAMAGRTERIQGNLDDAERVKGEATTVLSQYQAQLAEARNESSRIIEEARQTAEQLRKDLMLRAESEVNELRQRTRDDIAAAQERATADLSAKVGALAIDLAEKVVGANLDRDTNMRLIDQFIEEAAAR
ncbi:MAG: F0F1 ATP synthase subunit B [Acidimicrobiales bacterium]